MTRDPIEPHIREHIARTLSEAEKSHGVRVLFAAESGSRAWGFGSPDSDYDVRFIYAHPLPWYLRFSPDRLTLARPARRDTTAAAGYFFRRMIGVETG